MKDFLYIVALTPEKFITETKRRLQEITIEALKSQLSDNWQALIIGDQDAQTGNIIYLKSDAQKKGDKLLFALSYIEKQEKKPKYLVRLDDDDIISPTIIQKIEKLDFDCYADKYHAYYNLINGKLLFFRAIGYMANTVFHKYEHAICIVENPVGINDVNRPLLCCDHAHEFSRYYKNKKVIYSPKMEPIYLRIFSPVCETMSGLNRDLMTNFNLPDFNKKCDAYGVWRSIDLKEFKNYFVDLDAIAEEIFNIKIERKYSILAKIISRARKLRFQNK